MTEIKMLCINVSTSIDFGNEALARWNKERGTFVDLHKNKDSNYSHWNYKNLNNGQEMNWSSFVNNMLPDEEKPWYLHKGLILFFYFVCLSWIPKYYFDKNVYQCEFKIKKYVEK